MSYQVISTIPHYQDDVTRYYISINNDTQFLEFTNIYEFQDFCDQNPQYTKYSERRSVPSKTIPNSWGGIITNKKLPFKRSERV
jgi:CCR4-NOT transcriptional regulation complex NOT5 subunit